MWNQNSPFKKEKYCVWLELYLKKVKEYATFLFLFQLCQDRKFWSLGVGSYAECVSYAFQKYLNVKASDMAELEHNWKLIKIFYSVADDSFRY